MGKCKTGKLKKDIFSPFLGVIKKPRRPKEPGA
jgi:hypothetical protein